MHQVLYKVLQVCSIRMEFWHPSLLLSDSLLRAISLNLGKASGKSDPELHYKERKKCDMVVRRWEVVPNRNDSSDKSLQKGRVSLSQGTTDLSASETDRRPELTSRMGRYRKIFTTHPSPGTSGQCLSNPPPQISLKVEESK